MKYNLYTERSSPVANAELEELLSRALPLEDTILHWLKPGRAVVLFPGVDDKEQLDSLFLRFKQGFDEAWWYYVDLPEVKAAFPSVDDLSKLCGPAGERNESATEEWYRMKEAECGAKWDEKFFGAVIPREYMLPLALAHALSLDGEATLEMMTEERLDDISEEDDDFFTQHEGRVIDFSYSFNHPKSGFGWGGDYIVVLDTPVIPEQSIKESSLGGSL